MPTFGSLFTGIGGFDLGLERAGWTCSWQVEIDDYCNKVLAKHWPNIRRWRDVRNFPSAPTEESKVDLIAGGFPCQPVSLAGRRKGTSDSRWLWPEFARIIFVLRPSFVLVENVSGLYGNGMGNILVDLAACGYDAEWDCIPAAAVGAPHLRERVWIVAYAAQRPDKRGISQSDKRAVATSDGEGASAVAHADSARLARGGMEGSGAAIERSDWWNSEPNVGRVAHGIPSVLDGVEVVNAHEGCFQKGRAAGLSETSRVQTLWRSSKSPTPSSRHQRCVVCGYSLSGLPYGGSLGGWLMGTGAEADEGMRRLWTGVFRLLPHPSQDVWEDLFERTGAKKRIQKMAARADRLRALGNAVVPQVVEWIGRRLLKVHDAS